MPGVSWGEAFPLHHALFSRPPPASARGPPLPRSAGKEERPSYVGGPDPGRRAPPRGDGGGVGSGGGVQLPFLIFPAGALAASLMISSVTLGSRPSVWPLEIRSTSATTMPF